MTTGAVLPAILGEPLIGGDIGICIAGTVEVTARGKEDLFADKQLFVESNPVDENGLEQQVQLELQKSPGRKIVLKGDERLTVADVRKVMQHAQRGGARGVALGIEELKK